MKKQSKITVIFCLFTATLLTISNMLGACIALEAINNSYDK